MRFGRSFSGDESVSFQSRSKRVVFENQVMDTDDAVVRTAQLVVAASTTASAQ
jgi:hypothetical protein